jgi:flagellar motor switch protein FliN/FliY
MADDQPPVDPSADAVVPTESQAVEPLSTQAPDAAAAVDAVQAALDAAAELAAEPAPTATSPAKADGLEDLAAGGVDFTDQAAIDELLKQASFDDPDAVATPDAAIAAGASNIDLPSFQQVMADAQVSSIDLLRDVELNVKIELGRSRMLIEDVLKLNEGSVVELDKLAGDPVDVFVNDRLVARGEVLVLNDNFCVRVNEIVAGLKEEGL